MKAFILVEAPFKFYSFLTIYFTFKARVAFSTASTITPTSAKTAIPIVAIPTVDRISTATFIPIANTAFCRAILIVRREIAMTLAILKAYRP